MRLLIFLLPLLLLAPVGVTAADAPIAESSPAAEVQTPAFPGLSELGPRSLTLGDFVARSEESLVQLAALNKEQEALAQAREQFDKIRGEMEPLGSSDTWYVDRLNNFIDQVSQLRQGLDANQKELATRQQAVEAIRSQAAADREFWNAWGAELKKQGVTIPKETISQVNRQLDKLDGRVKQTSAQLLKVQESLNSFQLEVLALNDGLLQSLAKLRKATFRKNATSFFSSRFYRQFNAELTGELKDGFAGAVKFDSNYVGNNGWLFGLLAAAFLLALGVLRYYRSRLAGADEWRFILCQPLATAGFFSVAIVWFWLPAPPPLIRFTFLLVAAFTATILALPLLTTRRQKQMLVLAALVVLLTNGFLLISLPQPLFRLYIALLAVVLIPLLVRQVRTSQALEERAAERVLRVYLRLTVVVLTLSFSAQVGGYINFSTWLIQATFETGMVLLFSRMAVLLFGGGIALGIGQLAQRNLQFFHEFGAELSVRLRRLLKLTIYVLGLFYLLPVWRLFATVNEAWGSLAQLSVSIGEFQLSLQMVVSATAAFYLALQVSWVVQGVSEAQVLSRRKLDQGVRDAVKKLIHYAIVLIGFFLALSMLGLGLQNFVVLLGAFGVGIGFGLQDIVNNFLSGLILLFERPIKVGDGVMIDGEYGTVTRIGLRSTVVENLDQAELIVPNSQMISQKVTNWTLSTRRVRLVAHVGVAYGSDLEQVMKILAEVAAQHPLVLKSPQPLPLFNNFGGSSLDFELRVWIANIDQKPHVMNDLLLAIDRRFREEEIEIPFSQHDLHLRSVSPGIFPVGPGEE